MTTQYKWLPSEPTKKMLENVEQFRFTHYDTTPEEVYSTMWQAAPEVVAEPYAWFSPSGGLAYSKDRFMPSIRKYSKPLYTHPQPKLEPLSCECIESLFNESSCDISLGYFEEIVRTVEQEHGIGV
jgi:hypothetical protein